MKYFFYKKNKREYVPIEDETINKEAKKKLDSYLKGSEKYQIPEKFKKLNGNLALFHSTGNLQKANSLFLIDEQTTFDLSNKLNELTSKEWLSETVTVFAQKGLGANSKEALIEKQHPAPFSFQDVARLIKFFSKPGDVVLDPFSGVGSTLKACAIEDRLGIGIELNSKYYKLSLQRIKEEVPDNMVYKSRQKLVHSDSLKAIKKIEENSIDLIITSPPYWNILDTIDHKAKQTRVVNNLDSKYSEDKNDLANIPSYDTFISTLAGFFHNCCRILKPDKHMIIIVSDFRKKDKYFVFHADLARAIEDLGDIKLKGIKILHQRHKSIYPYGYPFSFVPNMHHQNVLIFQNGNKK